jgi:hypothetical protein
LGIPRRIRCNASHSLAAAVLLLCGAAKGVLADTPPESTPSDEPKSLPQTGLFSSIGQNLRMGFDHEVVRGHFDLGSPPSPRRYYCLVDTKTHRKEPNGVIGKPVPLKDGTTGLTVDSVSLFACADAEKQGMLVTAGYLLKAPSGPETTSLSPPPSASPSSPPPPSQSSPLSSPPQPTQPPPPVPPVPLPPAQVGSRPEVSSDMIDVAGVKLGMSLDEVRAVLKSRKLREYNESTETLGYLDSARGTMQSLANGRFVSVIAAWTPPAAGDALAADGESYEVMFTPLPGKERAMAIVHSVGYSPANAVRETALEEGLAKKYGGFTASDNLPESPTWRYQSGGNVQLGDPCNRRALFGGLGALTPASKVRGNIALKRSPDEFRFQVDHCGIAIVTEDHVTANGGALREERLVTRFTVTAYSPTIAFDGSTSATQLIRAARGTLNKADAPGAKEKPAPNL